MKTIKLFTLLAALLCATTVWAQSQTTVTNEAELRSAIQIDGANIILTADIDLDNNNGTLSIESGTTVTIDLGGHTLDRNLTQRGEGGGQVITVRSGATLNLSNGTLKGGWGGDSGGINNEGGIVNLTNVTITGCTGDDRGGGICNRSGGTLTMNGGSITANTSNDHTAPEGGGGIFNAEGATATLTNVSISSNRATTYGGGGICNYGTLTLDSCTIENNICKTQGGGVWNKGNATLNMQGAVKVSGNVRNGGMANNLFLKKDAVITITGSLEGSNIGITMEEETGTFTSGYNAHNSGIDPATIFTPEIPEVIVVTLDGNEAKLNSTLAEGEYYYIDHSWDGNKIVYKTKIVHPGEYTLLPSGYYDDTDLFLAGTYVVPSNPNGYKCHYDGMAYASANTKIILCDGAKLEIEGCLQLTNNGVILDVYGQAKNTGVLQTNANIYHLGHEVPGIGSLPKFHTSLYFHGGTIKAQGEKYMAGIGGGYYYGTSSDMRFFDANVEARGGSDGPGIGAWGNSPETYMYTNHMMIDIYGGTVKAWGGKNAAGIGGGDNGDGQFVRIYGGEVYAYGGDDGAGIGSGWNATGNSTKVFGGIVEAWGGGNGAGIGCGSNKADWDYHSTSGGSFSVEGGEVYAYGGVDAAGIGGGEDADGAIGYIKGGYVYAKGRYGGAGIGGGGSSVTTTGGKLTITGGTVHASAGDGSTGRAIGAGDGSNNDNGELTIDGKMSVRVVNGSRANKSQRVNYCRDYSDIYVELCDHPDANYTDNGSNINVGCDYCYTSTMPFTFHADGNWNDETKWLGSLMPHNGNNVAVKADATIPTDCCAHVGNITINGGSLTIADGGQLIHNNTGVTATVQKNIGKYTVDSGAGTTNGWYFIASPVSTNYTPNMTMLSDTYDLYRLNNTTWENWKQEGDHYHFNLENSHGYLYANSDDVTLEFTGTVLPSATSQEVIVGAGFNLIGNPFTYNVYANSVYYRMNGTRTGIEAVENYQTTPIAPCTGILINANAAETVTFTKEAPALSNNNGSLQIALTQANTRSNAMIDNAIVSFTEGSQLEKFHFGNDAKLYIPQGGKDYAIASIGRDGACTVCTEIPVNFKATENGEYTITVNPEGVEMAYLHLIDNLTGADVDLLVPEPAAPEAPRRVEGPATYTFTAKTTDYESRFKLVFSADGDVCEPSFAFVSNGEIIITGVADAYDASLQVIDVMGRVVVSVGGHTRCVPTTGMASGVYILRLIDGDNIKTQKIIIE